MTTKQANAVIACIAAGYLLYNLFYTADPNNSVASTVGDVAIDIISAVVLFSTLQILQNIKRIRFFFQTRVLYRNTDIRLSIAYLYRIKVENKYLLVKSRTRDYFQPVGGAFKTLPGSEKIFERLKVKPDRLIETENGIAKGDLRVYVRGINVIEFIDWFNSKEDRETSPWREFCEELISTEEHILPWRQFRYIDYKFKRTVQTPIFKLDSGDFGVFIYEIFDLVINDEQMLILKDLLNGGNTDKYIWVDEYLINRLGHDERTKEYIHKIAPHSKWALNLKWSK